MRSFTSPLVLVLLAGCAGSAPPPPAPAAPEPSAAALSTASAAPSAVAPPEPTPPPTAAPSAAPAAAPSAAPTAAPSVIVSLAPGAADVAAPPPAPSVEEQAVPALSTDQKAFVTGQLLGTEVVFITVTGAGATCASLAAKTPPAKGERLAEMRVLWKTGYYDLSNRMAQAKLGTYQGTFWLKEDATQGGVQVRAAPMAQGATGRIHARASRPGSAQSLDAELEVTVCAALDFTKKGTR